MTSRERVIRAIEFRNPDRVPIHWWHLPGAMKRHGDKLKKLYQEYPSDFGVFSEVGEFVPSSGYREGPGHPKDRVYQWGTDKGKHRDEWGCVWTEIYPGIMGQVTEHPLSDWKALDSYQFPDPIGWGNFEDVEETIRERGDEKYILTSAGSFFERLQWLRGYENLMLDLMEDRREVHILRDLLLEYTLRIVEKWLEFDIDGIHFTDDWGTQKSLIISPGKWRAFFKPCYAGMFDRVHQGGKHVFFHSDGYIDEIIPELIEVGVDVLNPQVTIMGTDFLAKKYGGKVCIHCDLDCQHILPRGSVQDVENHVKEMIRTFGSCGGGLIGGGEVGPDVPLSNALAMCRAYLEYGTSIEKFSREDS